jgi:hypothetical protein
MRRGVREIEWISSLDGMTPDPNESVKKPETEDHGCQHDNGFDRPQRD